MKTHRALAAATLCMALQACAAHHPHHPREEDSLTSPGVRSSAKLAPITDDFSPWQVDPRATPLPRDPSFGDRETSPHTHAASTPHGEALKIAHTAWRRSWGRFDMSRCELHPSCSRFGVEATSSLGLRGLLLTGARLMRNHNNGAIWRDEYGNKLDPLDAYTFPLETPGTHEIQHSARSYPWRWYWHVQALEREQRSTP